MSRLLTRLLSVASVLIVALMLLLPAAALAQSPGDERGVLVGVREDLTLDATSSASVVVGVQGNVIVSGHARLLVMVDGSVTLQGAAASVDTLVAIRAHVTLGPGTTVGTIRSLDSTVDKDPTATVQHSAEDLQGSMIVFVGILGTFLVLLYLGWALAVLIAGTVVAAIASSQVRRMARNVSTEPLKVLGAGVLGCFVPLIVGVLLFVTVIGIPLGFLILLALCLAAFIGFVAMGVWLGDMLLRRGRNPGEGRPIASALLGLFLLLVASVIPLVSFFVGWFALGTVTLSFWRALTGRDDRYPPAAGVYADPAWPGQQPGWGTSPVATQTGWTPQPGPAPAPPAPPAWGPQPPAGPPPGWGQQPPPGPPPGWGQPPTQDR
jgi:hypothetical protein